MKTIQRVLLEITLFLKVIFKPSYWLMTDGTYSKAFDKFCRDAIAEGVGFENNNYSGSELYRSHLKGKLLWVENHPYGSFIYRGMRPSRRTKILLRERYEEGLL